MSETRIDDICTPGLADTLTAPLNLSVWTLVRRLGSPASLPDVAMAVRLDTARAKLILDSLADAGLLERLPLRANRRQPTYRATAESIVVSYDPSNPDDCAAVGKAVSAIRKHLDAEITRTRTDPATVRHGLDLGTYVTIQLDGEERAEVAGLLRELRAIIESAHLRIAKGDAAAAVAANTHVMIDVSPALADAIPLPPVRFVPRGAATETRGRAAAHRLATLAPRERQVAIMLANGKTRPEIACELGVSANTVGTISRRVYAKLGVRRRAELSNRVRRGAAT